MTSKKCKSLDIQENKDEKTCPSIDFNGTILSFTDVTLKHVDIITIDLRGNKGQIDLWKRNELQGGRLYFSKKDNTMILSIENLYQHEITVPLDASSIPLSVSILFPKISGEFCKIKESPKIYVSTGTNMTILIGSLHLPLSEFSSKNFRFQIEGNCDLDEVTVSLKGKHSFQSIEYM